MSEAHKFSTLAKALEVFPELTWAQDGDGNTYIDNSKTGERAPVTKGQHIVKIADRYEVQDDAPEAAKPAAADATKEAPAKTPNPQVEPNAIGAPADSPAGQAAPAASQDASAAE